MWCSYNTYMSDSACQIQHQVESLLVPKKVFCCDWLNVYFAYLTISENPFITNTTADMYG